MRYVIRNTDGIIELDGGFRDREHAEQYLHDYDFGPDARIVVVEDVEPLKWAAVRTWNRTHTKATVTVTDGGDLTFTVGGKRAERAAAAIVTAWRGKMPGVYGLRADLAAAVTEAERLRTRTTMRLRGGHEIPVTPADDAFDEPVTEAD